MLRVIKGICRDRPISAIFLLLFLAKLDNFLRINVLGIFEQCLYLCVYGRLNCVTSDHRKIGKNNCIGAAINITQAFHINHVKIFSILQKYFFEYNSKLFRFMKCTFLNYWHSFKMPFKS